MSRDLRVFISGTTKDSPLRIFFSRKSKRKAVQVQSVEDADLVLFMGGSDINPVFYGEEESKLVWTSNYEGYDSARDAYEFTLIAKAHELGIPTVGICRGAQIQTVYAGGSLIQDVDGHSMFYDRTCLGGHKMYVDSNLVELPKKKTYASVNTSHHQMMFPYHMKESDYKLIGWHFRKGTGYHDTPNEDTKRVLSKMKDEFSLLEPEIVFYPKIKGLAIQYHPERMRSDSAGVSIVRQCLNKFIKINSI